MSLYALENLDDALDATRALLSPIDARTWLKLALVAFFVGGPAGGFGTSQYNVPSGGEGGVPPGDLPALDLGARAIALIAAAVAVLLLLFLVLAFVGAVMEFVLIESLRNEEVRLRRYWGRRWRQGARLFVFRLVVGLLALAAVAVLGALIVLPLLAGSPGVSIATALLLVPLFLVLGAVSGLVNGFTNVFVVPIMIAEGCGVLDGWRRLWPTLSAEWREYLAYAVAGFVLSIAGGILVGMAGLIAALLLLIPFGVLGAAAFAVFSVSAVAGIALGAVVVLLFALSMIVVFAVLQVPVLSYLRYYALLVLGDTNAELDLIPERRAAIRGEGE